MCRATRLRRPATSPPRRRRPLVAALVAAALVVGVESSSAAARDPDPAPAPVPATSANAAWVAASYHELLGRQADLAGLDYHVARLAAGGRTSRRTAAYALLFSDEGSRREVGRAYRELLGRRPDPAGEEYWTNHLTGHGVLDLRVLLLASDEHYRRVGGTDRAWLASVYHHVLWRPPDGPGLAYWLGRLAAGVARADAAGAIYHSDEALARRAESYHRDVLGRSPTPAERAAAADEVRRHGERHLRARLWSSDEAFEPLLMAAWRS